MRRSFSTLVPSLALAGALLLAACTGDDGAAGGTTSGGGLTVGGLETSDTMPDGNIAERSFEDFEGEEGTFEDFIGKPMVVNFWGSWCAPCIKEMPDFEAVHQELGERVTFVGVNVQDTVEQAQQMAEATGVTYPLVRDTRNELLSWVGGVSMPTTAFVSADGTVVKVVSKTLSPDELRTEIEAIS
ncbi:MAG: TlpA family protein disulfide reductase [Acidimicrobiales bacterium]|nr:TlpA family protein disulfide reductase [Acidimicrobiales bacterium]